jgi:lysophospholipase L1-like esterase
LENGYATDWLADGFTMTQGYDLTLEDGARENVTSADDDFVACTYDDTIGSVGMLSPIRFAVKSDENSYYKVKVTLQRADVSKEAKVNLFTERRHQHLVNEPIPEEGLVYETSVYVHNKWQKSGSEYVDKMLNIVALGENVAISSIEITKTEQGKTLFVLTDSTGCEQGAAIPYFALDHCQGVGSAMAKYLGTDWAVVNEGESGLSASAAVKHFANCVNDIKEGDVVWFQFGHNDDKVTSDPSTNGYLSTLESYYNQITEKGASLVVASPIERDTSAQYKDGVWTQTLAHYTTAASQFVEDKIAAGATNIAFVDLNTESLNFLNKVQKEIDEGRAAADLGSLNAATTRFYYYVNKAFTSDYTHPNDYGADNFANLAVNAAKVKIAQAQDDSATASQKIQGTVLSDLFGTARDKTAVSVPEEIYIAGAAPNSYYPDPLTQVVYYDVPWLISKVTFDEDGYFATLTGKSVSCKDISSVYGRGIVKIYDSEGNLKGTVTTLGTDVPFFDSSINGEQTLSFAKDSNTVKYDADAGDTYKVFVTDIDQATGADTDTVVSNELTEKDNIDVKAYLIQGSMGTENKEDFSSYSATLEDGASILNTNGWNSQGDVVATLNSEDGTYYASVKKTANANSHYLYKSFSNAVSSGKLYFNCDIRYISGTVNIEFTDGSKAPNSFPPLYMPLVIKADSNNIVGVYLSGTLVSEINAKEWVNISYTLDLDNAVETATVNGKTIEKEVSYLQSLTTPSPSQLKALAIVETTKATSIEYDITNIVLATLNTDALPEKTLTVTSEEASEGSVSIKNGDTAAEGTTASFALNTTVTAVAEPADGYRFTGWYSGETLVSTDAQYSFRLREDTSLKAAFEEAPAVDKVATYELSASTTSVQLPLEADMDIELSVINAKTSDGIDVQIDSENDVTWTLLTDDQDGVTLSGNVLNIASTTSLSGVNEKDIEVKSVCNGVEKTIAIKLHSYSYLLEMSFDDGKVGATSYDSDTKWTETNSKNVMNVSIIGRGGHNIVSSPFGGNGSYHHLTANYGTRTGISTFDEINNDAIIMDFDLAIGSNSLIKIGTTAANTSLKETGNTFLVLNPVDGKLQYYDYATSSYKDTGLTASTDTTTYSSQYHVQTTVDFAAKTEVVEITPYEDGSLNTASAVKIEMDITNATAGVFSGIAVSNGVSGGTIHVLTDNITVRATESAAK